MEGDKLIIYEMTRDEMEEEERRRKEAKKAGRSLQGGENEKSLLLDWSRGYDIYCLRNHITYFDNYNRHCEHVF